LSGWCSDEVDVDPFRADKRFHPIDRAAFEAVVARETRELLRREQACRGLRVTVQLEDQTVILIDDGLATGASMKAAMHAARVHPRQMVESLRREWNNPPFFALVHLLPCRSARA